MINQERLVDEFLKLVTIDALTKKERKMADYLLGRLKELELSPYEDDTGAKIGGDAGNVICHVPGKKGKPALLLMAHMDTVEPGIGKKPVVKGDLITSDGTTILGADDAAGIAVILEVIRSLAEDKNEHGDIFIAFTVAEEGGLFGAKNLDMKSIPADYAFILDDEGEIATVAVKAPFYNRIKAVFKGKAAHAGMEPEKGLSAILLASKAIAAMPFFGRIDEESSCNIGIIKGGQTRNIVCETCIAEGEVRSVSEEKLERYTKEILDLFKELSSESGGSAEVESERMYPGYSIKTDDEIIMILKQAAERAGLPLNLHATGGGSDTNIINGYGIPAVDISIGMENIHSTNECIRISNMVKACRFLKEAILTAFSYNR